MQMLFSKTVWEHLVRCALRNHYIILKEDRNTDRADKGAQSRRVSQRLIGNFFHGKSVSRTEENRQYNSQENSKRHAEGGEPHGGKNAKENNAQIGAEHINLPVGEVNQFEDAIHHGVAEGNNGVDAPKRQTVDYLL